MNTSSVQVPRETQAEDFDLVILGGGTGSIIAAWTFAGEGMRVAVVPPSINPYPSRCRHIGFTLLESPEKLPGQ